MIQFKSKKDTNPGKLASAIAYNIKNSDIEVLSAGGQALSATIMALVIAKSYTQNQNFTLKFDFSSIKEVTDEGKEISLIKTSISKEDNL